MEIDKHYKETHEPLDNAELEQRSEQLNHPKEGQEPFSEEQRISGLKRARFNFVTKSLYDPEGAISHQKQLDRDKLRASADASRVPTPNDGEGAPEVAGKYYPLAPEQWKSEVLGLRNFNVIKFPRVLQTLFYLLGYTREEICERGTNALNFKIVKELINERMFAKMGSYEPTGSRKSEFKAYQKIAFLKKNIADIEEEKVDDYSLVLGRILRWVHLAIDIRVEDVVNRRDNLEYLKQER